MGPLRFGRNSPQKDGLLANKKAAEQATVVVGETKSWEALGHVNGGWLVKPGPKKEPAPRPPCPPPLS